MARGVKSATVSFNSNNWEIESIPVGVPEERETFDITALGDTQKKFFVSGTAEKNEIDIEVVHIGAIATSDSASALSISITDDAGSTVSLSFGNCYLIKVEPGSVSTGDRKATQKLTFRPAGATAAAGGGN